MNHHQQFLQHIQGLPLATDLLRVCRAYKTATDDYAFELNGRLKGGLPLRNFESDLPFLQRAICATLRRPLIVYRMTSEFEFSASVLQVLEGPFRYQSFMSTSDDASKLSGFLPKSERPLLLEIECPPGIAFAPLDLFPGTDEGEYLLGCGTTFQMTEEPRLLTGPEVGKYIPFFGPQNLMILKLHVIANPQYVKANNLIALID